MVNPYPQAPKKLQRSRSDKVLGGVCGGVATYLNMDPTLVRVLTAILTLILGGAPLIIYIVMLIVVPEETSGPTYPSVSPTSAGFGAAPYEAPTPHHVPQGAAGRRADDAVWGTEGAPWEQRATAPTPAPRDPVPSDPTPVEPTDPEPIAPSEPEAPVVTPPPDSAGGPNRPNLV